MVDQAFAKNRIRALLAATAVLAAGGCSSSDRGSLPRPSGRTVTAAEFSGVSTARPVDQPSRTVRVVSAEQARVDDVVGTQSPAANGSPSAVTVNHADDPLVDAKVGDLNGEPVFAHEWLRPLSGRLAAEGATLELAEFRALAGNLIRDRLAGELKDQLLYAEIQSELTPEEKAGLRQVLRNAQREQVRKSGGSVTVAERQLQEANDQTIDSFLRDRERQILVAEKYRREIDDKVQVSQRDIKLYYDRNYDEFNPPPLATLHRIRIPGDDTTSIEEVRRRLAAGEPFEEVSQIEANNVAETVTEREIDGEYSEFEFYSIEPLNKAAQQLTPGAVAGPIEHGSSVSWLHLEKIEDRSTSLYDAQLFIENQLRATQRRELEQRYIYKLIRRAGLAEFDEIVERLTDIAVKWYYAGPAEATEAAERAE